MADKKVLTEAAVRLIPVIEGLGKRVAQQLSKSDGRAAGRKLGASLSDEMQKSFSKGGSKLFTGNIQQGMAHSISNVARTAVSGFKTVGVQAGSSFAGGFRRTAGALGSSFTGSFKSMGGAAFAAAGAGVGFSFAKGFKRALAANEASAKLKGLGYNGEQLTSILEGATAAVDGMIYSAGDAAGAAGGLLAAGVKPGQELNDIINSVGNAAALSGRDFSEMGVIFNKVFATGKLQGDEAMMFMESQIPIISYLSKTLGKSAAEVQKLMSDGKISSKDFARTMKENLGTIGKIKAENSFTDSLKAVLSNIGKLTEPPWTAFLSSATPALQELRTKIKTFAAKLKDEWKPVQDFIKNAFSGLTGRIKDFDANEAFGDLKRIVGEIRPIIAPLLGLLTGFAGKMLSGLPIIGGFFGGMSAPLGLLLGLLAKAYTSSERFKNSMSKLVNSIGGFIRKVFGLDEMKAVKGDSDSVWKQIGDSISDSIDKLSGYIDSAGSHIGGLRKRIMDALFNKDKGEGAKNTISGILDGLASIIGTAFAVIVQVISDPSVQAAFSQFTGALATFFADISGGATGKTNADSLAKTVGGIVKGVLTVLTVAVGVIGAVIKAIQTIIATPVFQLFSTFIQNISTTLSKNSKLLTGAVLLLVGAFTAFAVLNKIRKFLLPIIGAFQLFGLLNKIKMNISFGERVGSFFVSLVKGLKNGVKALPGIGQAFVKALPEILKVIAVAGIVLAALAALGWLLKNTGVETGLKMLGEVLRSFGTELVSILKVLVMGVVDILAQAGPSIASALLDIFKILKPVLDWIVGVVMQLVDKLTVILQTVVLPILSMLIANAGQILGGIGTVLKSAGGAIAAIFTSIGSAIKLAFEGLGGLIESFAQSLTVVISSLANGGLEAAAAAVALAAGITALSAAMAGGTLMNGAAGIGGAALGFGKDAMNWLNPFNNNQGQQQQQAPAMQEMMTLLQTLKDASGAISMLQYNWSVASALALTAGYSIVSNLGRGLLTGAPQLSLAMGQAIAIALSSAQLYLDSNPLQVRAEVPAFAGGVAGLDAMSYFGGTNTANTTQNFNVSNPNPWVAAEVISNKLRR